MNDVREKVATKKSKPRRLQNKDSAKSQGLVFVAKNHEQNSDAQLRQVGKETAVLRKEGGSNR